jgi:three-Cys-motif partner protein
VNNSFHYTGREQSYIKHRFLSEYLKELAFKIGRWQPRFVYVDGFSGPWKNVDENYSDTSFMTAIDVLRLVRNRLREENVQFDFECIFIEEDPKAFAELQEAVAEISDVKIHLANASFEDQIGIIVDLVGNDFSFVFVDPTGWKGLALAKIWPVLKLRSEVIINFMFNHINWFFEDDGNLDTVKGLDQLFGGEGRNEEFQLLMAKGLEREDAILKIYEKRLAEFGGYNFVTRTPVLVPTKERTNFYLVYGTNHLRGLEVFRRVEKRISSEQIQVRSNVRDRKEFERTGQVSLFNGLEVPAASKKLDDMRQRNLEAATIELEQVLMKSGRILYEDAKKLFLVCPLVSIADLNSYLKHMREKRRVIIPAMKKRERVAKDKYWIEYTDQQASLF